MKFENYDKLEDYVKEGLVEKTKHPALDLFIYNYSRQTQYDGKWDEITLQTRGLILDGKGNLIAKSFNKFFNYSELQQGHFAFDIIAKEKPIVLSKEDGSLGICFYLNGEWVIATRGSFASDQAIKAMEMLKSYRTDLFNPNYVYLVEITYDQNMIVVVYPENKLFFLSIMDGTHELSWEECKKELKRCEIPDDHVVKQYDHGFDYDVLKNSSEDNREGYVVKFEPSNYRVKIKFDEYVRLHRLITNFSNVDIWECLKKGDNIYQFLDRVPDEFDKWVRDKVLELEKSFNYILKVCVDKHNELVENKFDNRKDMALWVKDNVIPRYQKIIFSMMDNRNHKPQIWDLIRPNYQKPFWNKNNN